MKKAKRIAALALALCAALALAGCGGKAEPIDVDGLAQEIVGAATFGEPMNALDSSVALGLYSAPDGSVVCAFAGTGATAEEAAVFNTGSAENAAALVESLRQRNQTRIDQYASYNPAEVPKLESAVILSGGPYVVLIVAQDASAAECIAKDALAGQ